MKISGFTIIRNAILYDFQIVESIRSVLDLVDEFVVVAGDSIDETDLLLAQIDSPKLKIIKTLWDIAKYSSGGMIYANQTDIALKACSGDWCVYLQSDEVMHHDSLETVRRACEKYLNNPKVEGFVLKYVHVYGDYNHYIDALHLAYPREVRIVRNLPDIHSWRDAQSFRFIKDFDYKDYWQKEHTRKLRCVLLEAYIFHYGWSRDPRCMVGKVREQVSMHEPGGRDWPDTDYFDYGNLNYMPVLKRSHPRAMEERIARFNWHNFVRYEGKRPDMPKKFKWKYRILNLIESRLLGGRTIGGFKNYKLVK